MVLKPFLVALGLVAFFDAISYMVVTPSIVFYVLSLGGSKEAYGSVLSIFALASFAAKPVLGYWTDRSNCFRLPYLSSITLSSLGGFIYFLASGFGVGKTAVAMVFLGRIIGGFGAANIILSFTYLAQTVPPDQITRCNVILCMARILGLSAGPGLNVLLTKVHGTFLGIELTPLNSVGLMLAIFNALAFLAILVYLEDPKERMEPDEEEEEACYRISCIWESIYCLEILVPIISVFSFNANFQLIETGFAPAANHALGWGPVQSSGVLGSISITIALVMGLVYYLSSRKIKDTTLMQIGLVISITGYTMVWYYWVDDGTMWHFYLPATLGTMSFPFLAAPTRSVYTKSINAKANLRLHQGLFQAILSCFASIAGFITPGLVAAFVLKTPGQVQAGDNTRELTGLALIGPGLSALTLVGLEMLLCKRRGEAKVKQEEATLGETVDESTALIDDHGHDHDHEHAARSSIHNLSGPPKRISLMPRVSAYHRQSAMIMGIDQFTTKSDMEEMLGLDVDDDDY